MTFMTGDQKLLATDARDRVRVPAEWREVLLDEFERSGLSGVNMEPCDLRKSFNGLEGLVKERLGEEPRRSITACYVDCGGAALSLIGHASPELVPVPSGHRLRVGHWIFHGQPRGFPKRCCG